VGTDAIVASQRAPAPRYRPCLWPPSGKTTRPWYGSRTTSNRYGEVTGWDWLTDTRGKTRKFASKEACQAACDAANGGVRA